MLPEGLGPICLLVCRALLIWLYALCPPPPPLLLCALHRSGFEALEWVSNATNSIALCAVHTARHVNSYIKRTRNMFYLEGHSEWSQFESLCREVVGSSAGASAVYHPFWGAFVWHIPSYVIQCMAHCKIILLGDKIIPQFFDHPGAAWGCWGGGGGVPEGVEGGGGDLGNVEIEPRTLAIL